MFKALLLAISILTSHPLTEQANMSVLVRNLNTGEVIEEHRANHVVPPASVMKLLTTGAALETLGADFRFITALTYTGMLQDGVLHGNIYIRGCCDPSLGDKRNRAFLNRWVRAIREAGIRSVDGAIVADMTMLDAEALNPNWLVEDAANYYAPGIFALNYLGNTLNIVLRSGPIGTVAEVLRTDPAIPYLRYINHVRCTDITYDGAFVHGLPYSEERYLTGAVPSNLGTFGVKSDIPNPGLLLAQDLTAQLSAAGISVSSPATYISEFAPKQHTLIYEHRSDTLGAIIAETNIHSNNLYAESLFRYLGTQYLCPGTVHNAQEYIRDFWRRRGVDVSGALIKDGCGLAPQDAVSAQTFVQLLTYMSRSRYWKEWYASLPVSGRTGTLKSLCAGTELEGRIHAKSGTIAGTKNFAGYIEMPNGDRLAFAILINSAPGKAKNIQTVIQKYLLALYAEQKK